MKIYLIYRKWLIYWPYTIKLYIKGLLDMFPVQILSFTKQYTLKIHREMYLVCGFIMCVGTSYDCRAEGAMGEKNQENHGNKCNSSKFIEKHTTN